jgi:hypothetical protein
MTDRVRPALADTLTAWLAAAALGLGGFALVGCGADDAATADPPAASTEAGESDAADSGAVAFEPAYPEEVSSEGLAAEDVRQQEMPHSHGSDAHAHDDGEDHHDHDDGDHAH